MLVLRQRPGDAVMSFSTSLTGKDKLAIKITAPSLVSLLTSLDLFHVRWSQGKSLGNGEVLA